MPKAPVNEDNGVAARKNEIRRAGQVAPVESKAVTHLVSGAAHGKFGKRIPTSNSTHQRTPALL
jgi:hypothetical protein